MDFLRRHHRKLLYFAGIVGGSWLLGKYASSALQEITVEMDTQRIARANVKRRFIQNQQDCSFTVASLMPTLSSHILADKNVEALVEQLKLKKGIVGGSGKLSAWDEFKFMSFSRTISAAYLVTLLVLFTHTQLNLLGRFIYIDSIPNAKSNIDSDTERKFLTLSWYLLNKSWTKCRDLVDDAVMSTLKNISIKDATSYQSMIETIQEIRKKVEVYDFSQLLLPKEGFEQEILREGQDHGQDVSVDPQLAQLLNETRDFLESSAFSEMMNACFDSVFDLVAKSIEPIYIAQTVSTSSSIQEASDGFVPGLVTAYRELPLAKVIPVVSNLTHKILNGDTKVQNLFVECVTNRPEVKAFSVIVYTSWERPPETQN